MARAGRLALYTLGLLLSLLVFPLAWSVSALAGYAAGAAAIGIAVYLARTAAGWASQPPPRWQPWRS